jgi:hypothetical protein
MGVVVVLAIALLGYFWYRKTQTDRLQQRFGPAYGRAVKELGSQDKAETEQAGLSEGGLRTQGSGHNERAGLEAQIGQTEQSSTEIFVSPCVGIVRSSSACSAYSSLRCGAVCRCGQQPA